MDGSVTRMSNADRLRSGLGLSISESLVDTGPVEQKAPSSSSQPSLAHPGRGIRSHRRRYTQQGAAFQKSNYVPPTASAPPTSKTHRVQPTVLRNHRSHHRLQNPPPRVRRTTPRTTERPDVNVRRQQTTNPSPSKHGRVPPTHATHYDPTSSAYE
jgi:hypothetical protein